MTDYYKLVIKPTLREDAANAGDRLRKLPRWMRRALADGGRWLDRDGHKQLAEVIEKRPCLQTVVAYRARLAALIEQRKPESALASLQEWIHEAESSGNRMLAAYAVRLKRYAVARA
jgi:stearoyl-CoA desaturase (delta-9 desaturase)